MSTSLLVLLDDIATILDDVAAMTKVAAGKTAGVVGDDLAVNAEQVSGVRANRELPVVWAVFKGSARNKLILVPVALAMASFAPWMINPFLMMGGCYLCYEGFEKIAGNFLHPDEESIDQTGVITAWHDPSVNLVAFEKEKIKGAIRTDFVLSAEIIVIALGSVQEATLVTQIITIITVAALMTVGVYGLVAAIVRLDDFGQHLIDLDRTGDANRGSGLRTRVGERILAFAPFLMKGLMIAGTTAMFLVGGGILVHGLPMAHDLLETIVHMTPQPGNFGPALSLFVTLTCQGIAGVVAGGLLIPVVSGASWVMAKWRNAG